MLKPLNVDHRELWKILKEMGIPDHLTRLLRKLYFGKEVTELDLEQHGTMSNIVQNLEKSTSRLYIVSLLI